MKLMLNKVEMVWTPQRSKKFAQDKAAFQFTSPYQTQMDTRLECLENGIPSAIVRLSQLFCHGKNTINTFTITESNAVLCALPRSWISQLGVATTQRTPLTRG